MIGNKYDHYEKGALLCELLVIHENIKTNSITKDFCNDSLKVLEALRTRSCTIGLLDLLNKFEATLEKWKRDNYFKGFKIIK